MSFVPLLSITIFFQISLQKTAWLTDSLSTKELTTSRKIKNLYEIYMLNFVRKASSELDSFIEYKFTHNCFLFVRSILLQNRHRGLSVPTVGLVQTHARFIHGKYVRELYPANDANQFKRLKHYICSSIFSAENKVRLIRRQNVEPAFEEHTRLSVFPVAVFKAFCPTMPHFAQTSPLSWLWQWWNGNPARSGVNLVQVTYVVRLLLIVSESSLLASSPERASPLQENEIG